MNLVSILPKRRTDLAMAVLLLLPVALLGFSEGKGVHAQQTEREHIEDSERCPDCQILFSSEVLFGDSLGGGRVGLTRNLLFWKGMFITTLQDETKDFRVFSTTGEHLQTVTEANGTDFVWITALGVNEDSLWVLDSGQGKGFVFSENLRVLREVELPITVFPAGFVELSDGEILVNGESGNRDHFGIDIFRLNSEGKVARAYGGKDFVMEIGDPREPVVVRHLVPLDSGGFVSALRGQYTVEFWSLDGVVQRELVSDPSWFERLGDQPFTPTESPPFGKDWGPIPIDPPVPAVVDISLDESSGLLYVLGKTPQKDWNEAIGAWTVDDWSGYWDGIVEVVDINTSDLLKRAHFDEVPLGFGKGNRVFWLTGGRHPQVRVSEFTFNDTRNGEKR